MTRITFKKVNFKFKVFENWSQQPLKILGNKLQKIWFLVHYNDIFFFSVFFLNKRRFYFENAQKRNNFMKQKCGDF